MKKFFRYIFLFFKYMVFLIITFCVFFFLYYTFIVFKAKTNTPIIVEDALKSSYITLELNGLTKWQKNVLLKIEDPKFYDHSGIDRTTPGAGLTTISQSVVKKLYFENFQPGIAKIKQSFIARFAFDTMVEKDIQLKLFVNLLWFGKVDGKDVIGIENAANIYYKKEISELTEDEYLSIVAMMISPKNFHIIDNSEANKERVERMKKVIDGTYIPNGLMDLYYDK